MEQIHSIDGTVIGFQRSGKGSPLVLVHGTSADHRRWTKVLPHFERHFAVYAMDRRGRGGSGDSFDYDLMREAEDVAAVVEAACEQSGLPVCLLGHSYGAVCSLEAALLTDKLSQVILYEPPLPTGLPMYAPDVPDRIQSLVDSGEFEAALEVHFREIVRMPEHELEVYRSLPMWQGRIQLTPTLPREMLIDQTYRFDSEKFADFQVPTLLLLGSDSPPIFRRAIELLESALPNSRVVEMPGQQHIAMDTNPELFVREVLHYLGVNQPFSDTSGL
jgi:pimeloyl-ACP methyl ester carboxylesterase